RGSRSGPTSRARGPSSAAICSRTCPPTSASTTCVCRRRARRRRRWRRSTASAGSAPITTGSTGGCRRGGRLHGGAAPAGPDLPVCLCWANENWTRRWDGREHEVLMAQEYGSYDPRAHMQWLATAFADPRYVTVHGRPLFLVYNAGAIPDLARVVDGWREAAA